ncbi:MAG TPA: type II secretion system protein [Methylomirabilota bacterium]|nr:type II secretion system protein [Methylomirabilota bacterium]
MRLQRQSGFTLIELMVVLAILAIVTGAMVSEMRGTLEDAILRESARKIIDACDATNARAISTGRAHVLVFNIAQHKFAARPKGRSRRDEADSTAVQEIPAARGELDARITLSIQEPGAIDSKSSEAEDPSDEARSAKPESLEVITFFPDGTCEPREFLLRDRMGVQLALRINPITSHVRILEARD